MIKYSKESLDNHIELAMLSDWCELSSIIIDLELELQELKSDLTKKELKALNKILEVYEEEKMDRLKGKDKQFDVSKMTWLLDDLSNEYY